MHFCTKKTEKGSTILSWYRWNLSQDFFDTLKTYGRLPLEMNVKKLMDNMKERDDLKRKLDEQTVDFEKQLNEKAKLYDE